jgi:hypothetical protein
MVRILTLEKRHDRREQFEKDNPILLRPLPYYYSLPHLGSHQSFNFSFIAILGEFYNSKDTELLFLEDDAVISDFDRFAEAREALPSDWGMLYLGANVRENGSSPYLKNLVRLHKAWTTHAVLINRPVAEFILKNYNDFSGTMVDAWIADNVMPRFKCFMVSPIIATQRAGFSDIWGHEVDYSDVIK